MPAVVGIANAADVVVAAVGSGSAELAYKASNGTTTHEYLRVVG